MAYMKLNCGCVYLAALAATLNFLVLGISSSYTASTKETMQDAHYGLVMTDSQIPWIASITQITAIVGAVMSGYLSQKFGRKTVMMYNSLPFLVSWLMVAYARSITWIYLGRLLCGLCIGVVTVAGPTYLTEISTPQNRGRLGTLVTVAFATGILTAMTLGMVISWRWLALTAAGTVAVMVIILYFVPESPYWLIANSEKSKGLEALIFLRGDEEIAKAAYENIINAQDEDEDKTLSLSDFLQPVVYKPLFLAFGLFFFQQFSGIGPLIAYTKDNFKQAGGSLDPTFATLIVGIIQVPINSFSSIIIDKAGRRIFYVLSGIFLGVGLLFIAFFVLFADKYSFFKDHFGWMPMAGYIIFFLAISIGYAPLPHIMTTEMTPLYARSAVVGLGTVCIYIFSFLDTVSFQWLTGVLTTPGAYFLHAGIVLVGAVFGYIFLPETKGKPLEKIQEYFLKDQPVDLKVLSTEL